MCVKDMVSEAKTKFEESKNIVLSRSFDMKMALEHKGGKPIKSVSMHKNCSTPLWKVIALTVGIIGVTTMLVALMKKACCNSCDCE